MITAGMPLLMIVCLVFPAFLRFEVFDTRNKMHTDEVIFWYSYIYQGYQAGFSYWRVFIHGRKGLVAVISVLSDILTVKFKGYLTLCALVSEFGLQMGCNPYVNVELNKMEAASLLPFSFACLFQGMTQNPKMNIALKQVLSVMGVMLMVCFVLYMMFGLLTAHKSSIRAWVRKLERYEDHSVGLVSVLVAVVHIISTEGLVPWPYLCTYYSLTVDAWKKFQQHISTQRKS